MLRLAEPPLHIESEAVLITAVGNGLTVTPPKPLTEPLQTPLNTESSWKVVVEVGLTIS